MNKYKCIIWDWNGTLFDDIDVSVRVMNSILQKHNLPELSNERYKEIFEFPVVNYYNQLGFDLVKDPFESISVEFITNYQRESLGAKLNESTISVLEHIKAVGLKQVILSASQIENLEEQVNFFGIRDYFDSLLGLDHCHATSKVELGKKWLLESGFDKRDVLMIGDTLHDYETATEIGCDCILNSRGHQSRERILIPGAPVVDSLLEIRDYLETGKRAI
jgi:Predicted phosphatases